MRIIGQQFLIPLVITVAFIFALFIIRRLLFKLLHKWAKSTETQADDIVINSFKTPSILWCIAIGLYIGIVVSEFSLKYINYISKAIYIIVIFSITTASANLAGRIFRNYIQQSNLPIPSTGLFYGIVKGTIIAIGVLIILNMLGISIAPLITALGIGGLAVALALKDTLANLFSGIHILLEKSVRIGDFIKLETGQEGYVDDITWRTTRIRMLPNNMVVIPNSKLAQSIVINYYLPEKRMSLLIQVSVSYYSDLNKIENVLLDEAQKAVGEIPGLLAEPAPLVRFIPGFGESSLDFTLVCHIREITDQYPVQHELRKRIFKRFQEEGIEIPFPHRTVYLRKMGSTCEA